jgi:hypothetical protein
MRNLLVSSLVGGVGVVVVLAGCSSPEPEAAPSQFCNDVQAWQNASLQAAKDAINNGETISDGLDQDFSTLTGPLQTMQGSLPDDAPSDVKQALTTYLSAVQAEGSGTSPNLANSPAPNSSSSSSDGGLDQSDPGPSASSSPSSDFAPPESATSPSPASSQSAFGSPTPNTYSSSSTSTSGQVSNAELQAAAQTVRDYIDQECPTTLPSDGSSPE